MSTALGGQDAPGDLERRSHFSRRMIWYVTYVCYVSVHVSVYMCSLIRVRCHFGGLNRLVLLPPELILLPLFALPLFPPSLLCLQLFLRSIANVMRVSGCDVPEWMLKIKKLR